MLVILRGSTFVFSQHFPADDYIQGSSPLKVVAVVFNGTTSSEVCL